MEAELARLRAESEDEQLLDAEGDFPATFAKPSRPHREDGEDEDEEVRRSSVGVLTSSLIICSS